MPRSTWSRLNRCEKEIYITIKSKQVSLHPCVQMERNVYIHDRNLIKHRKLHTH